MRKYFLITILTLMAGSLVLGNIAHPAMAAEKGKYGGILKFNLAKHAGVFGDPLEIRAWNERFIDFVFQTMMRPNDTQFGVIDPELATNWEIASDKSHVILKLRKGVKFHDGTDFNAQAAKWNIDRWVESPNPQLSMVKSTDVIDDYTFRLNLSDWDATILSSLCQDTFIISPTAFKKNGAEWAKFNPVGTGPFKLLKFKRGSYLKYEKFVDYWEKGLPYLDGVLITQIPDPMTALASLKNGDLDALVGVDAISGDEMRKTGGFDVVVAYINHEVLYFNSEDQSSIFSDRRVREALEYAIDKHSIAKSVYRNLYSPTYEIVHSINILTDPGTVPRKYNPGKAKQLIKEAVYPKGLKIKLTFQAGSPITRDLFTAIQKNLRDVGIEVEANPLQGPASMQAQFQRQPPNALQLAGQPGSTLSMLEYSKRTLHRDSLYFQGAKKPEGFHELLEKALLTMDKKEQLGYLSKMEKLAYNFAMITPLFIQCRIVIQNQKVKDVDWFWAGEHIRLRRAWLSE